MFIDFYKIQSSQKICIILFEKNYGSIRNENLLHMWHVPVFHLAPQLRTSQQEGCIPIFYSF